MFPYEMIATNTWLRNYSVEPRDLHIICAQQPGVCTWAASGMQTQDALEMRLDSKIAVLQVGLGYELL